MHFFVHCFYRSEFMRQFLLYGHVLSTEEELYADYELKKNPPTLDNFKEQVCFTFVNSFILKAYVQSWSSYHFSFADQSV